MPASPGGGAASPSSSAGGATPAWRRGRRSSQLTLSGGMYVPGRQSVNREGFEKMVKTLVALEDDKKRMKDEFDAERARFEVRQRGYWAENWGLKEELRAERAKERARVVAPDGPFGEAGEELRGMHEQLMAMVRGVNEHSVELAHRREAICLDGLKSKVQSLEHEITLDDQKAVKATHPFRREIRVLMRELHSTQKWADTLRVRNQEMAASNKQLKVQFASQEGDRQLLVQQLVAAKQQNNRLRDAAAALRAQVQALQGGPSAGPAPAGKPGPEPKGKAKGKGKKAAGKVAKAKAAGGGGDPAVALLERKLEAEKQKAKRAHSRHLRELERRSKLQHFLLEVIEEVQAERLSTKAAFPPSSRPGTSGSSRPASAVHEFRSPVALAPEEKARVLEELGRKEALLTKMYDGCFGGDERAGGAVVQREPLYEPPPASPGRAEGGGGWTSFGSDDGGPDLATPLKEGSPLTVSRLRA